MQSIRPPGASQRFVAIFSGDYQNWPDIILSLIFISQPDATLVPALPGQTDDRLTAGAAP